MVERFNIATLPEYVHLMIKVQRSKLTDTNHIRNPKFEPLRSFQRAFGSDADKTCVKGFKMCLPFTVRLIMI